MDSANLQAVKEKNVKSSVCTKRHRLFLPALALLPGIAAFGGLRTIYPETHDGMTPSQQITNAVALASDGDTILFRAGTYQLDGSSCTNISTPSATAGTDITNRNYVFLTNKKLEFAGETDGKWSDGVVLRGNGNDRFCYVSQSNPGSKFRNITFENFASCDRPDQKPDVGNADWRVTGGAVMFGSYDANNIVSNCVFRGNVARTGGAIGNANVFDCYFTNNAARYGGGAIYGGNLTRCTCVGNMATNSSGFAGVAIWTKGAKDCVFSGNRACEYAGVLLGEKDMLITNCVFKGNFSAISSSSAFGSGVMELRANTRILDCVFDGNSSNGKGGVIRTTSSYTAAGSVFERCTFTNNFSTAYYGGVGAVVWDGQHAEGKSPLVFRSCRFVGNYMTGYNPNLEGVVYCGSYSNCAFVANYANNGGFRNGIVVGTEANLAQVVDCAFTNNFNREGGMVRYAFCTNTVFFGSEVPQTGGVVKRCRVVDCKFVANKAKGTMFNVSGAANLPSGDATESTLVKCEMDLGCIVNSVLVDCRIHSLDNAGAFCVFFGHNVATNCLIENCIPPTYLTEQNRGLIYRFNSTIPETAYVDGSDYVNCTFADNVFPYIMHHPNEYGVYTPFKNCLFYNNKNASGTLIDAYYRANASSSDSGLALSNCVIGAAVSSPVAGATWHDLGGNRVIAPEDLKIAGDKAEELGVDRYSLLLKSPALGMGDASMFTALDRDLAGNLRLRDGALDPGCFQCWLMPSGFMLMFK